MDITHDTLVTNSSSSALWNPNAAANWSLLFTPAFGAYIHMINWRVLGDPVRANTSRRWFYAGIALLVAYAIGGAVFATSEVIVPVMQAIGLAFLLSWYMFSARHQAKYIKEKYADAYEHKHWGKALLYSFGLLIGYLVFSAALAGLLG